MEYTREILDRETGRLNTVSIGDWIMVTELGERYGLGSRQIRAVLNHMGLLWPEKGRYRLRREAVERGLGIRHDKPKSGKPFDVISPLGQELIASVWDETVADYEADLRNSPRVIAAREALGDFKGAHRNKEMTTQMEVCWVRDHFSGMTHEDVAKVVEVSPTLARKYGTRQDKQRSKLTKWRGGLEGLERISDFLVGPRYELEERPGEDAPPVEWESAPTRPEGDRLTEREELLRWYGSDCRQRGILGPVSRDEDC